jgi:YD repeat-containing protein
MHYEAIRLLSLLGALPIGVSAQTAAGYLSRITNAVGHQINITSHDGMGRPLGTTDQNGVVTDLEYNARGWLTKSTFRPARLSSCAPACRWRAA